MCVHGCTVILGDDPRTGCTEIYNLFCCTDPTDAAAFIARFGGEPFEPARNGGRGA